MLAINRDEKEIQFRNDWPARFHFENAAVEVRPTVGATSHVLFLTTLVVAQSSLGPGAHLIIHDDHVYIVVSNTYLVRTV